MATPKNSTPKKQDPAAKSGPMRINKYLAQEQYTSRRGADELITAGRVFINGRKAVLGDMVSGTDVIEVKKSVSDKTLLYYAYYKPTGVVTHSPQGDEKDIESCIKPLMKGQLHGQRLFPIGRLDKDSHGLIILTNDGRITSKLLNPDEHHEKQYVVETVNRLSMNFQTQMERGVTIKDKDGESYKTARCIVHILGDRKFSITLTEGKNRQIRRMTEACGGEVRDLKRVRIMNIELGHLSENNLRKIKSEELEQFLSELGIKKL